MTSNRKDGRHGTGANPIVVLAADEKFAMPLATTVRSALEHLSADVKLRIFVLDAGIKDATKQRLLRSWPASRYEIEWLRIDASDLAGSPVSGHVNLVSYYRILIPRVLPRDVHRAIYLDSDLLICSDLAQLWARDTSGYCCLAVQDCSAPYIDAEQAVTNYETRGAHIGCARPIPNFRALGLDPKAAYFNAGVLLIDLDAWRHSDVSTQLIECLATNRAHVQWWDQYAMNVVLSGRWGRLDPRWNQGSYIYRYPSWEQSPYDRQSFNDQRDDPFIVHFTARHKPWRASCEHPWREKYFEYVRRTEWADWKYPRIERFIAAINVQERRIRRGRYWLREQAARLLKPNRERKAA